MAVFALTATATAAVRVESASGYGGISVVHALLPYDTRNKKQIRFLSGEKHKSNATRN
jgi:hypothetical protein